MDRCPGRTRAMAHAALALAALSASQTEAINITVDYDPTQPGAVDPAFDLFGAQLTPVVNYAASFYEDVFQDVDHSITLTFWYTDLPDNQLGNHDNLADDANGRELTGTLRFDLQNASGTPRTYFYDSTPADDSEYSMGQALWESLSPAQRADFYVAGGTVPATFELGYFGTATGGPASNGIDMLTLVMHEMGHALGMSAGTPSTVAETMDGDYDFDPAWIFGAALAADNIDQPSDIIGHLDDRNNAMFPSLSLPGGGSSVGIRKRPSHVDLFSMASGHNYTSIDVPRREFYGGNNFNLNANWSGNNNPDFNDEAFVRTGGDVFLFANATVGALHVERGTDLFTAVGNLTVNGLLAVESTVFATPSRLLISDSTTVQAQDMLVGINSIIELDNALLTVGNVLDTDVSAASPATITGHGTVQVNGTLINNGVIKPDGGTLSLFSLAASPLWDLDGIGTLGQLDVTTGDLFVTGALTDPFDGDLTVGPIRNATFNNGFALGADGNATINGSLTTNFGTLQIDGLLSLANLGLITPEVNGAAPVVVGTEGTLATSGDAVVDTALTVAGTLSIGLGIANLNEPISIQSSAAVNIGLGGQVRFNDATTLGGGDFSGPEGGLGLGSAFFRSPVTVSGDTTMDLLFVDLDGQAGATEWTLTRDLVLNVDHINGNTDDTFTGTFNINGLFPTLAVNLSSPFAGWTMAGTMNLEGNGMFFGSPQVTGSTMTVTGDVNVDGLTRISASTIWDGSLAFEDAEALLQLQASPRTHHITASASVTGPGTLAVGSGAALSIADGVVIDSNLQNDGTLQFGDSPGHVGVTLNFVQGSDGVLIMELGGSPRTGLFDTLDVEGQMVLDGTLNVVLINSFMPAIGDAFDLLDWGRIDGEFAQLNLPALADGLWDVSDLYQTGVIRVAVPEPAITATLIIGVTVIGGPRRRRATATSRKLDRSS